jgi:hypothetical protein
MSSVILTFFKLKIVTDEGHIRLLFRELVML